MKLSSLKKKHSVYGKKSNFCDNITKLKDDENTHTLKKNAKKKSESLLVQKTLQ